MFSDRATLLCSVSDRAVVLPVDHWLLSIISEIQLTFSMQQLVCATSFALQTTMKMTFFN